MKRVGLALAILLAFGASSVQADRWVPRKRLPKAIDHPIVRKKVREDHKPNKKQNHPPEATSLAPTIPIPTANA